MVKRKTKTKTKTKVKTKTRKVAKRKTTPTRRKKVTPRKASSPREDENAKLANRNALWQAYRDLQKRADEAWAKFRNDVSNHANSEVLVQDNNQLLLLLGECDYMARECMRHAAKRTKK